MEFACVTSSKPKQENDHFIIIIDQACAKTKAELDNQSIWIINYCRSRSYPQVQQLSNIYTADGNYIFNSVFQEDISTNQSESQLKEIIQDRPKNKYWNKWREFLCPLCYEGSNRLQKVVASGREQYIHQYACGLFITQARPICYTKGTRRIGMTTNNIIYHFDGYKCYKQGGSLLFCAQRKKHSTGIYTRWHNTSRHCFCLTGIGDLSPLTAIQVFGSCTTQFWGF